MSSRIVKSFLRRWPGIVSALACLLATCTAPVFAADDAIPASPQARPRVALVLSGGGARGIAHIGVLRVLRELHVPVDMVVGTSMGAVIGGAYAAGRSVEELESITRDTAWESVLSDRPLRDTLHFRRREEDLLLPSRVELAVTKQDRVSLPRSVAGNAALEEAIARLLPSGMRDRHADQLALPFRSVASDLVTGELVELSDTSLFLAMRASLAVPGVFAPARIDRRLVADGGLVRNLPVDIARALGADVIIAVNVGTPLAPERELGSAIGVARQMLQILTEQNVQRSLKELRPEDILIAPDLQGVGFLDFSAHEQALHAGEAAAQALAEQLQRLAVPAAQYAALDNRRLALAGTAEASTTALPLAKVEVEGSQHINPAILVAQTGLEAGQRVTPGQVRQAAAKLYGRGDLESVDTEIRDTDAGRHVTIRPSEASWSRNRLRLGLELASDFNDDTSFTLSMLHVASSLNSLGAELRTLGRVGTTRLFDTEFWQPLAPGAAWYVAPGFSYVSSGVNVYSQGNRVARVGLRYLDTSFAFGRELGNWGDVRVGVTRRFGRADMLLPAAPEEGTQRGYETVRFMELRADTLDSLAFPTRGYLLQARGELAPASDDNKPSFANSGVIGMKAISHNAWAGHVYGEWSHAAQGVAPQSLGGFLRLSGTPQASLNGRTNILGRLVLAHKVGTIPATLGSAVRLGFSVEAGGAFSNGENIGFRNMKKAGSVFLSADTRFGPVYLGLGGTYRTGEGAYLFLGPVW
jgi:NTE family protein